MMHGKFSMYRRWGFEKHISIFEYVFMFNRDLLISELVLSEPTFPRNAAYPETFFMINKATILGRLARDPDLKTFSNGGKVCRLRVITSRSWQDQSGTFQEKAEGHNVAIYVDKIAERIAEKSRKGEIVFIEGPIETRSWTDSDGVKRYSTEIAIRPRLGGIRRLPSGAPAATGSQDRQTDGDTNAATPEPDTIPQVSDDPFDDPFLGNDIGEFGSDLSFDGTDGEDEGLPF